MDLGSRRELFVDHLLVERLDGVELRLQQPRSGGVALRYAEGVADHRSSFYTTVLKDGPLYRMYYRSFEPDPADRDGKRPESITCYAESPDGIHWARPALGLFEINGSRANNVILPLGQAFAPFIDIRPGVPASERYKASMEAGDERLVVFETGGGGWTLAVRTDPTAPRGLMGLVSADGIRWRPAGDGLIAGRDSELHNQFDATNVMFWSEAEQQYLCFLRHADGGELRDGGIRVTARSTSSDFLHWSRPVPMTYGDTGTTRPAQHLYVNNTQPYFRAPHIYIALQAREAGVDPAGGGVGSISDGVLLTARPGSTRYDFTFRESFVRPGPGYRNWTARSNYLANGIVPTGENEMSFYVQRQYAQTGAWLERMVLRLDGFASVHAAHTGGELLTRPFTFTGRELEINYATSAAGGLRVEIQDADGRPVRLRFRMHDADLFSFLALSASRGVQPGLAVRERRVDSPDRPG